MNDNNPIALVYNNKGKANIELPLGAIYDSFKLTLFVQIMDELDAITVYIIPTQIISEMKNGFLDALSKEVLLGSENSNFSIELFSGEFQQVAKNIISFTSILNNPQVL